NTAVFSVVDAVFLQPLPYRDAGRLMIVQARDPASGDRMFPSVPGFHFIHDRATSFEDLAAIGHGWITVVEGDTTEIVLAPRVSIDYFRVLDGQPLLGRTFSPGDTEDDQLVVLSYRLWERGFGKDPRIIGELVNLDMKPYRVIGVMREDYLNEWWQE